MQFALINLGCRVNQAELEKIGDDLSKLGYQYIDQLENADFAIVNTCTVTEKADKKSIRLVKKLEKSQHLSFVFVTGCYAELEKNGLEGLSDKIVLISQTEKNTTAKIVDESFKQLYFASNSQYALTTPTNASAKEGLADGEGNAEEPKHFSDIAGSKDHGLVGHALERPHASQQAIDPSRQKGTSRQKRERLSLEKEVSSTDEKVASKLQNQAEKWQAFKSSRVFFGSLSNGQTDYFQHTRAFVKVQDGCNQFCSYCRIPFARGRAVSRDLSNLLSHIEKLDRARVPEIVLTGINMSTYMDSSSKKRVNFSNMLEMVLGRVKNSYVRLSSIEPHSLDDDFFNLLAHPKMSPHLHLPLQASDDRILKRMNRQYSLQEFADIVMRARDISPNIAITTDIITGYPDETTREFEEGCVFLNSLGLSGLHVFPFSFRPFTNDFEKKEDFVSPISDFERICRAKHLREMSEVLKKKYMKRLLGKQVRVVVEKKLKKGAHPFSGMSEYALRARIRSVEEGVFEKLNVIGKNVLTKLTNILDGEGEFELLKVLN